MTEHTAAEAIHKDWEAVGGYLLQALGEAALELGGEAFKEQILSAAHAGEALLPNPAAFALLETAQQGSAEQAFARAEALQIAAHSK